MGWAACWQVTLLTSYVLGGELVKQGVSLVAVTLFLVGCCDTEYTTLLPFTPICLATGKALWEDHISSIKKKSVFYGIATFYTVAEIVLILKKVGFKNFNFTQTIFHSLSKIKAIEPIKEGYGEGSFVTIKALK